ncbi:hypothetical protein [Streptomyces flaveus]|uniref:hypothetical protein n=1 Tax=Streptomyces flaveus TaxID=66370 RepID=UPI00331EE2D2
MSDTYLLYSYAITKMTKGQRKALLAAVDGGGCLPDGVVSARVLESIPEAWARTDEKTGSRFLGQPTEFADLPKHCHRRARIPRRCARVP